MAPPARFLCDQCATAHGSMQTCTSTLECSWQIEILTPVSSYFTRTKSNTTNTLWHKSLYIWFLQLKLCKPLQLQHYLYPILYQHRTTHGIINLERKMLCKQDAVSTPHSPLQTMVLHGLARVRTTRLKNTKPLQARKDIRTVKAPRRTSEVKCIVQKYLSSQGLHPAI